MEYSPAFRVWATVESVASVQPTVSFQYCEVNGQDYANDDCGCDCDGSDALGQYYSFAMIESVYDDK
jgi:hypothetical protein